jgi:hypothetical protein
VRRGGPEAEPNGAALTSRGPQVLERERHGGRRCREGKEVVALGGVESECPTCGRLVNGDDVC